MKQNKSIHEEIKKEIQYFSSEIDRLNFLSKELQATEDFDALEKLWINERKEHGATLSFWRGADIQVVPCQNGETEEDWRALETLQVGYRIDEPCPSRFPEMLSGLLVRLSETPPFIGRAQRYEYYFNIHKICMQLELNGSSATKAQICGRIIFEQIRLLNSWIHELTVELQTPPPPNLLEQGWKYYFAYGRNVNRTAMLGQDRCPSALGGIQASLENYRFAIDQRNVATVIRAEGMSASGILWLINPDDELQLDAREGVNSTPPYYRKETVTVKITHAGAYNSPEEVEALIYVSNFPEGDTLEKDM